MADSGKVPLLAKARAFASITRAALSDQGPRFVVSRAADYALSFWAAQYYKLREPHDAFSALGRTYTYFYHLYNITWKNERAVEIAVAQDFVDRHPSSNMLEVGNVLSWYRPVRHDVLDKYEEADGVINEDVVDFDPGHLYDVIVAISTLEHVGWDERPRDETKAPRAIKHLMELLAPGGSMLITVPLGHNPGIDAAIAAGTLPFTTQCFMMRLGRTRWREAEWEEVRDLNAYHSPYRGAKAVLIGIRTPSRRRDAPVE
jgi:SAM-dependent methyltransferase